MVFGHHYTCTHAHTHTHCMFTLDWGSECTSSDELPELSGPFMTIADSGLLFWCDERFSDDDADEFVELTDGDAAPALSNGEGADETEGFPDEFKPETEFVCVGAG